MVDFLIFWGKKFAIERETNILHFFCYNKKSSFTHFSCNIDKNIYLLLTFVLYYIIFIIIYKVVERDMLQLFHHS